MPFLVGCIGEGGRLGIGDEDTRFAPAYMVTDLLLLDLDVFLATFNVDHLGVLIDDLLLLFVQTTGSDGEPRRAFTKKDELPALRDRLSVAAC